MEENNTVTAQLQLLRDAKEAVTQLSVWKSQKEQLEMEDKKLNKKLAADEKQLSSDITSMIKKRRDSVSSSYDKEISAGQDKLKKVKNEREKARSMGINDRIKQETAGLRAENAGLKKTMKKVFSDTKTPSICRSYIFYSLYDPGHITEWLGAIIMALFAFLGLPALLIICFEVFNPIMIILIFAVFIIVFGALYILGLKLFKNPHQDTLRQGEEIKKQIRKNSRQIKRIIRSVKRDKNEESYGLETFDYDIAKWESQIEDINKKKEEALETFDNVTSKVISDEVTESERPKLEETRNAIAANKQKLEEVTEAYSRQSLYIAEHYEAILGKEFMTTERMDALMGIIHEGNATTVTEAIVFFRNSRMG